MSDQNNQQKPLTAPNFNRYRRLFNVLQELGVTATEDDMQSVLEVCREIEAPAPANGKPLTAELLLTSNFMNAGFEAFTRPRRDMVVKCMEEYAAQQVAAALADKKEPGGKFDGMSADDWAEHFAKKEFGAYRDEDAKKLFLFAAQTIVSETAALREELEKTKASREKAQLLYESRCGMWKQEHDRAEGLLKELEAVKKELDTLRVKFLDDVYGILYHQGGGGKNSPSDIAHLLLQIGFNKYEIQASRERIIESLKRSK
jgi:uncharacterized small protein (DUF1192 family)